MYIDNTFPPDGSGRLAQLMRLVDSMRSDDIAMAVEVLIAQLDARAGDVDLEDDTEDRDIVDEPHDNDGDEEDGNASEDDWMNHGYTGPGAGCPIADPGGIPDMGGHRSHDDGDEDDGLFIRKPHRDRIRRTRCTRLEGSTWRGCAPQYRLKA